jgi:predicted DNA-binding protein (UPF0251 family)
MLKKAVNLLYEEYEAIVLADYENLSQGEAAIRMDVSRPTFTRIYDSARKKIARAFAESLSIVIEGGSVAFDGEWYRCASCHNSFSIPVEGHFNGKCPVCLSEDLVHLNRIIVKEDDGDVPPHRQSGYCICPSCGMKLSHQAGVPCRTLSCPVCKTKMIKENL